MFVKFGQALASEHLVKCRLCGFHASLLLYTVGEILTSYRGQCNSCNNQSQDLFSIEGAICQWNKENAIMSYDADLTPENETQNPLSPVKQEIQESKFKPIEEALPNTPYWLIDENLDPNRLFIGIKAFSKIRNYWYWQNKATVDFASKDEPEEMITGGLCSNKIFNPTHFLEIPSLPNRKVN